MDSIETCIEDIRKVFSDFVRIDNLEVEIKLKLKFGLLSIKIKFQINFPMIPPLFLVGTQVKHPIVDIFGFIKYNEYYNWLPDIDICKILLRIKNEFESYPPIPSAVPNFPDFMLYANQLGHRMKTESDVQQVIRSTPEYSLLKMERDALIESNTKALSETTLSKQAYNTQYQTNQSLIIEYRRMQNKISELSEKINQLQQKTNEALPKYIEELEREYSIRANDIYSKLLKKEITSGEFCEKYQEFTKFIKLIQLAKGKLLLTNSVII